MTHSHIVMKFDSIKTNRELLRKDKYQLENILNYLNKIEIQQRNSLKNSDNALFMNNNTLWLILSLMLMVLPHY